MFKFGHYVYSILKGTVCYLDFEDPPPARCDMAVRCYFQTDPLTWPVVLPRFHQVAEPPSRLSN
jgi:predicted membrane-bound dolichyl-phosphate-mannose-protein mannosyltransferase